MNLIIDLPQPVGAQLEAAANKAGVSVNEIVYRTIAEKVPVDLDEDVQALRLIEQWISEAPTQPDQVEEAEADLREFQRAINQKRTEANARLVYFEPE
jgi:hypothetical protein